MKTVDWVDLSVFGGPGFGVIISFSWCCTLSAFQYYNASFNTSLLNLKKGVATLAFLPHQPFLNL